MVCGRAGDLRAFLDGEMAGPERERVEEHLASCVSCRAELGALAENATIVRSAFERLAPASWEVPAPSWSRVRARAEGGNRGPVTLTSGVIGMFKGLLRSTGGSRFRMATGAIAVLVALSMLFTLPPVRTAAGGLLSVFRVKKFTPVTVDPSSLPNLASPEELGSFSFTGDKQARTVASLAEAGQRVGFNVPAPATLPAGLEPAPKSISVTGAWGATYTPDIKKVRAYLSSLGASNVKLPDNLDGAPITMQMPPAVAVLYTERGGVDRYADGSVKPLVGQKFLFLGATTSPTLNVPEGIDVEQIRAELLKVPGLPPDLVNQLKAVEDWRNTVVVPVVKGTSREVTVQGEKGLLINASDGQGSTLLWLKGNVIYTLTGNCSEAELLATANSLR